MQAITIAVLLKMMPSLLQSTEEMTGATPVWDPYFIETLEGSFSSVSTPLIARVGAFCTNECARAYTRLGVFTRKFHLSVNYLCFTANVDVFYEIAWNSEKCPSKPVRKNDDVDEKSKY